MDASLIGEAKGPYPGLRRFREGEWRIFCGREALVATLVGRLEQHNLLLLHGGSGSGKSSVVIAGVIPMLEREHRRANAGFGHAVMRPSDGPFSALAGLLAEHLGAPHGDADKADYWAGCLMANAPIVPLIDARILESGLRSFCLVLDQFEEIFTWARDHRRSDVELLTRFLGEVAETESEHFFVLVTMRSDFLGACAQYRGMAGIINGHQYYMPNLDEAGMVRAITEPATLFGGKVDPALVRTLMLGAANAPDPLPLLQHALMRMAHGSKFSANTGPADSIRWTLTEDDLRRVSGADNPLSAHADEIWNALAPKSSDPEHEAMEWIFRSLFDIEKSGEMVRRPRELGQLKRIVAGGSDEVGSIMVEKIVNAFKADGNNLLVVSQSEDPDRSRVDISHEALLRQWTRISGGGTVKAGASLKQKELEDGLMWRSLAFSKRAKDWLGPGILVEARKFYRRMDAAPERGRRYLSDGDAHSDVRDSADWRTIGHLIRRSAMLQAAFAAACCILLLAAAATPWLVVGGSLNQAQKDAENAKLGEAATRGRAQADQQVAATNEQSAQLRALVAAEANAALREQAGEIRVENATLGSERVQSSGLVDQLNSVAATAEDSRAFMWVGDADTPILQTNGVDVSYDEVVAGRIYQVRYDMALRADMPGEGNQSAPRIGLVRKGGSVRALAQAERSSQSGQYWLHVRPIVVATIYIQVTRRSSKVDDLTEALRSDGYTVPPVETLSAAAGARDIRYCNAADRALADQLRVRVQNAIGGSLIRTISMSGRAACSGSRRGVLELWLGAL